MAAIAALTHNPLLVSPRAPACCYFDRSDESSAYSLPRANFCKIPKTFLLVFNADLATARARARRTSRRVLPAADRRSQGHRSRRAVALELAPRSYRSRRLTM